MKLVEKIGDYLTGHTPDRRLKAEKRANMTPAQRRRRAPPKVQINFRATLTQRAEIDALAKLLNCSVTDAIALAVNETLARRKHGKHS